MFVLSAVEGDQMLIGLTGGIATGKSTVSKMFRDRGAKIVDADQIAREVVEPGTIGVKRVAERFGQEFLNEKGEIDRKKLAALVFQDEQARKDLNSLLHPLIRQRMREDTERIFRLNPKAVVIWDVPLLFESQLTDQVDQVIVVYIPESLQIHRLMSRNQLTKEEAIRRIQSQWPIEKKKSLADYVIDNQGSLEKTERQVDQLWNYLVSKNGSSPP